MLSKLHKLLRLGKGLGLSVLKLNTTSLWLFSGDPLLSWTNIVLSVDLSEFINSSAPRFHIDYGKYLNLTKAEFILKTWKIVVVGGFDNYWFTSAETWAIYLGEWRSRINFLWVSYTTKMRIFLLNNKIVLSTHQPPILQSADISLFLVSI